MNNHKKLFGLILAGGFSRRMGQDKALLNYHGKAQIEYVYDLLKEQCQEVFLSKRADQSDYAQIPSIIDDQSFKVQGPIAGILSAMKKYPQSNWLVMACDLPFVTKETLQYLIENQSPEGIATAFKSSSDDLPEPLCAIWRGEAFGEIVSIINQGISCPRKILIKSQSPLLVQKNKRWLDNVNDLNEYNQVKSLLQGGTNV